jgi:hypothetical protein
MIKEFQELTVDNLTDILMYADGKNCILLKEAAMESFETLGESTKLVKEVMASMAKRARLK